MSNTTNTIETPTTTPTFSVNGRTAIQTNAKAALLVFNFGWITIYAENESAAKAICYANC